MAQTYVCDLCGQVAADFMVTTIVNGTVVAVGVECILDWAMPIAEAYQAVLDSQAEAPQQPQEGSEPAPAEEWEEGYPQGRQEGEEPPDGTEGDGREDTEAGQASNVAG